MKDSIIIKIRQFFCRHPIENVWGSGTCTDHDNGNSKFTFHHCYKCKKDWILWKHQKIEA